MGSKKYDFPPRSDSRNNNIVNNNRPRADSHALPAVDALGMRLGNGSSSSLYRPPNLSVEGGLPARPGTSLGEERSTAHRQWANPLDLHYGRNANVPASPLSPKVVIDSQRQQAAAKAENIVVITQVNSTSPPMLSPLEGVAGPPPTGALPSPPRSTKGSKDDGLKPVSTAGGLPSPALSLSHDEGNGLSVRGRPSGGEPQLDDLAGAIGGGGIPKPIGMVIQTVAAKRDTLTMSGSRQTSLSMTIEAFEKSLLTAQQESEQRAKAVAMSGSTTPQLRSDGFPEGEGSRSGSRSGSRAGGMAPHSAGLGISAAPQMAPASPMRPEERRPSPGFANNLVPRSQSALGMRGPPPSGPLPSPRLRAGDQRPHPPYASRSRPQSPIGMGPRSDSPLRLPPPQNRGPRAQSPMGRGPAPPPQQQQKPQQSHQTPLRSPGRPSGAGWPIPTHSASSGPGAPTSPINGDLQQQPFGNQSGPSNTQHSPQFDLEIHRPMQGMRSPRIDFPSGASPVVSTGPSGSMMRAGPIPGVATAPSSPVIRGPAGMLPRRPGLDEYGVSVSRANSDRDLLRGPPKAAYGAYCAHDATPQSPATSPLRSPAKIEPRQRDNGPQPLSLSPKPPPPLQLSPAPLSAPLSKHHQQHSLELSWSFSKEGADATKPSNKFTAPLPSPLFANRDFDGALDAMTSTIMNSSGSNNNNTNIGRSNSKDGDNLKSNTLKVPSRGPSPAPSPKFPFNDGKDHDHDEEGLSGPPTPDSTNWPLPPSSPRLGHLQPPPARSRSSSAASHWHGGDSISITKTTNGSVSSNGSGSPWKGHHAANESMGSNRSRDSPSRPARTKVPPPLNLFSAQQYAEVIGSTGPYTPSPTRSMTTPIAACDVAALNAGGEDKARGLQPHQQHHHPGAIGMARGLSLVHEQQHLWGEHQKPQQVAPSRRPNHGLEAPTGIADRFGTGFI